MGNRMRVRAPRRVHTRERVAAVALATLLTAIDQAHPLELTEPEAIAAAFARDALQRYEAGHIGAADAEVMAAATLSNPVAMLGREGLTDAGDRSFETTWGVEQTFVLSGRRGLEREAAQHRAGAVRADLRNGRRRLAGEVRRSFARVLHGDAVLNAYRASVERVGRLRQRADQLATDGEGSGYDARRLAREVSNLHARAAASEAALAAQREILAGQVGAAPADSLHAMGTLLPEPPPPVESLRAQLVGRPDLAALLARGDAYAADARAGARAWLPDVTVGIGHKRVSDAIASHDQLMLSLAVPLPLFERGQSRAALGASMASAARAEHELLLARYEADLQGQWQKATRLRAAALTQSDAGLADARALAAVSAAAYRGGEGGVLELLDAERMLLESELLALDLSLRARLARIELDLVAGVPTDE